MFDKCYESWLDYTNISIFIWLWLCLVEWIWCWVPKHYVLLVSTFRHKYRITFHSPASILNRVKHSHMLAGCIYPNKCEILHCSKMMLIFYMSNVCMFFEFCISLCMCTERDSNVTLIVHCCCPLILNFVFLYLI